MISNVTLSPLKRYCKECFVIKMPKNVTLMPKSNIIFQEFDII